jgi:hypothetical protein
VVSPKRYINEVRKENEMSNLNEIVGKTVVKIDHIDNFDGGIVIAFSDGTFLSVTEYTQTGKLDVSYYKGDENELEL